MFLYVKYLRRQSYIPYICKTVCPGNRSTEAPCSRALCKLEISICVHQTYALCARRKRVYKRTTRHEIFVHVICDSEREPVCYPIHICLPSGWRRRRRKTRAATKRACPLSPRGGEQGGSMLRGVYSALCVSRTRVSRTHSHKYYA